MLRSMKAACLVAVVTLTLVPALASAQRRPVVERIEPTSGPVGSSIDLVGRDFEGSAQIYLGETQLSVTRRMPNRVTVTLAAGAQSGQMTIRQNGGEYLAGDFRVTASAPTPRVERLTPTSGSPGAEVTITGQNFSSRLADNTVTLNGRAAVVRGATPTTLEVVVPEGATTGTFRVRVNGAGEAEGPTFTVNAPTTITGFDPRVGPPATRVLVRGTGFSPTARNNRVYLNGTVARVSRATATELEIAVPRGATTGRILVDVQGAGRTESTDTFTVRELPRLDSFSPEAASPGQTVSLRGSRFGNDLRLVRVTLGETVLALRSVSDTEVVVEIPSGSASGYFNITVDGLGPVRSRAQFGVALPLSIADFQPRSGGPNTEVRITGAGFGTTIGANTVTMNGTRVPVIAATATELMVRVPQASSGPLEVTVRGGGTARTTAPFVLTRPPFVASFTPTSGAPGTEVTIRGTSFGDTLGLVEVTLDGRPMQVRAVTPTEITAVVPAGATSGRIAVSVRLQGSASGTTIFRVDSAFSVASITPTTATAGQEITLRGEGFAAGARVTFPGARNPISTRVIDAHELRVTVPGGATTGTLVVSQRGGRSATTPVLTIGGATTVVITPPSQTPGTSTVSITGLEPQCTRNGCEVVIRGTGFSTNRPNNRLTFGGRPIPVRAATATELRVRLPNRPNTTGTFVVDVRNAGTATSAPFTITP